METPLLHDATLLDATLHWDKQALVEVRFEEHGPRIVTLKVREVRLLQCPHENPWGASVSVNDVRGPVGVDGGFLRIEIEMQSGDTVVVEGKEVEWQETSQA
jgi:hypothetical protein